MSGGRRKTKDSGFKPICLEKGLKWRPRFSGGPRAYSLLKPSESGPFTIQATEHNNRYIDM